MSVRDAHNHGARVRRSGDPDGNRGADSPSYLAVVVCFALRHCKTGFLGHAEMIHHRNGNICRVFIVGNQR